jgi:L-aspartate oxidase
MKNYDCIIIGSGIAGLYISHLVKGRVLILTKKSIHDSNTRHAQGGIAAPVGKGDSAELYFRDTINAGAGLCNERAVKILVEEAADRIKDLIEMGVSFDSDDSDIANESIALTKEGGHSVPRVLHAGGDATGEHIERALSENILDNVDIMERCPVTEIMVRDNRVQGVRAKGLTFGCRFLVLATGGAGQLFSRTTNPKTATGEGVALAFRAGAEITDMEFFQFHPTALCLPGTQPFLISEAMRGEGGILLNVHGDRFTHNELAPRDVVTRSIVMEMRKTQSDHVFLDVTRLPSVSTRFPGIYHFCMEHGIDITKSWIPVAPAAHYMMGGVKVNEWGETNIQGLFAGGEVACTGVHGANRLASNSLIEALVFGRRIAQRIEEGTEESMQATEDPVYLRGLEGIKSPSTLSLAALKSLMWDEVGIIRNRKGLEKAVMTLASQHESTSIATGNMALVGRLMAEAALMREESRGAHFRSDFPCLSKEYHIVFRHRF